MVVDDEPAIVDAVRTMLESEGYNVLCAYSGEECLRMVEKKKPDLILLDIRMPEMDGWETLRLLKEKNITDATKVSMFTAITQVGTDIFGLQDVVTDYIRKPFSREELLGSIRKTLGDEKDIETGKLIKVKRKDREIYIPLISEDNLEGARKYKMEQGHCYLLEEKKPEHAYEIFKDYVEHGIPGMCITRLHIDRVKDKYNLIKTPILWLAKIPGDNNLSPTDLGMLREIIKKYIDKSGESIILLDGFEYLSSHNEFDILIKYFDDINDIVMESKSLILIPLDRRIFEEKEMALLERNMKVIRTEVVDKEEE